MSRLYPEHVVGGYSRVDGAVDFYARIDALLRPDMRVVDFGAGRGVYLDEAPTYRQRLMHLRGRVAEVVGVDIDEAVHENPGLDTAHVVAPGERTPLADASVDLVVSDHTFEHIDDPAFVAGELDRILKPGGWICARTPNKRGYIATAARVVPNRLHTRVLEKAQPLRLPEDVFPTRYHLNTPAQVRAHFPEPAWTLYCYTVNAEPAYFGRSLTAWRAVNVVNRLLPQRFGATWLFYLHKRP